MSSVKLIQQAQQGSRSSRSPYGVQLAPRGAQDATARQPGQLTDLRPLSVTQRRLQNIANDSARTRQLQRIQSMVQRSEPVMQLTTRTQRPDATAVQLAEAQQSAAMTGMVVGKQSMQLKADARSGVAGNALSAPRYSSSVAQMLMNPAPVLGTARSFHVAAADLGNGTGTTAGVRLWAQANAPGPNPINFRYAVSNAAGTAVGAWNGPFAAPNPAPAGGANWHAGHVLARQNGGAGHIAAANWIMPQNPQVNMGHAGTYAAWRAHEVAFHNLVGVNGYGVWEVA